MGCDIHMLTEVKQNGVWVCANEWADEDGYNSLLDPWYSGRNYNLFACLAGVRNCRGFAGCDMGNGFKPISEPKGLPEDASPEVSEYSDGWSSDGHSHSYLTLRELEAYDWDGQSVTLRGVLSEQEYLAFKKQKVGGPVSYCGGVSGNTIITLTEAEYKKTCKKTLGGKRIYVQAQWKQSYRDAVGAQSEFFKSTMLRMRCAAVNPDDVRIVFLFDN